MQSHPPEARSYPLISLVACRHTVTCRLFLKLYLLYTVKARVDRTDQTTRIYTQEYVKVRENGRAYCFNGVKLCR